MGLDLSAHPFVVCPSYVAIAGLPLRERVTCMRDPEVRRQILSKELIQAHLLAALTRNFDWLFRMGEFPDYEPDPSTSVAHAGLHMESARWMHVDILQRRLTPDGWRFEGTTRLECRAWASLAEHIFDSLGAGDRVVILGRLRQRALSGGGSTYDVLLEDLGPSLVFTNAWLIPPGEAGGSAGDSAQSTTTSTDGDVAEGAASDAPLVEEVVR